MILGYAQRGHLLLLLLLTYLLRERWRRQAVRRDCAARPD